MCQTIFGSRTYSHGFTLIEALITLSIISILFSFVIPGFFHTVENVHMTTQKNTFIRALQYTRSEAIKRNKNIFICASTDQETCSDENRWETGWLVFDDKNDNQQVDQNELLRQFDKLDQGYRLSSNANVAKLKYLANGKPRRANGALPMMTVHLCSADIEDRPYEIVINAAGRIRTQIGDINDSGCES